MMLLAAALAQQGAEGAADVAHGAGWILEHAWIFPLIPFVSFLLILGFGKQLKYKGAELGVTALAACFVLALGAGYQWVRYVDDVNAAAGHGEESAAVLSTSPAVGAVGGPGEAAAGAAAQSPTTEGTRSTGSTGSDHGAEATTTSGTTAEEHGTSAEGGEHEEAHVVIPPVEKTWTWWQSGGMDFDVGILVDGLSVMMLFVVTFISLLVHVYSTDYVHGDIRYTHFF